MAKTTPYTRILIAVMMISSLQATDTRFPDYDPKMEVLDNIYNANAVAYCLVHIEKGKKFTSQAKEPEVSSTPQYVPINSSEWFKERRTNLNLIRDAQADEKKKSTTLVVGDKITEKQIIKPTKTDEVFQTMKFVNPDDTVFTPKHTTTDGDGYGVIIECYLANSASAVKRQVRYVNCPATSAKFVIVNYRMVSDGDGGKQRVTYLKDRAGIDLSLAANGGDRFFIGPLSDYADGSMDAGSDQECAVTINSEMKIGVFRRFWLYIRYLFGF